MLSLIKPSQRIFLLGQAKLSQANDFCSSGHAEQSQARKIPPAYRRLVLGPIKKSEGGRIFPLFWFAQNAIKLKTQSVGINYFL